MSRTLQQLVMAAGLIAFAMIGGCDSNVLSLFDKPVPPSGSFPTNNTADGLPAITLIDQHGEKISLAALKGKPVLVDFIYATCATACPLMTSRFAKIADQLGSDLGTKVTMVSITIDPEHDHPAQLLDYAKTHGADRAGWLMLTGKRADIEAVMRIYRLNREREADGTIGHVTMSFLVGPDGRQIRMYDTMEVAPGVVISDIDKAYPKA